MQMSQPIVVERKLKTQVLRIEVGARQLVVTSIARGKNAGLAVLDSTTLQDVEVGASKAAPPAAVPATVSGKLAKMGHVLCANSTLACIIVDGTARLYDIKTTVLVAAVAGGPFDHGEFSKRYLWLRGEFGNGLFAYTLRGAPTKFPDPLNVVSTTITAFTIDRRERWCAIGTSSGYVECIAIKTGEQRFGGRPTRSGHVTALAFNATADTLYVGSASGMLVRIALG